MSEPSRKELERLRALYVGGQLAQAAGFAKQLTRRHPDHAAAWNALGGIFGQMGLYTEAIGPLRRAAALAPADAQVRNNLGSALALLGHLPEAEGELRLAVNLHPHYAEALNSLATTLAMRDRLPEAEQCYRRAVQSNPQHAKAWNNLGVTLRGMGRLEEALACHRRALQLAPDLADAHQQLGSTLHFLGRLDEAQANYRQCLRLRPDDAECFSDLLLCLNYSEQDRTASREEALRFGALVAGRVKEPFATWNCPRDNKRLRVGLVSGDLRSHPVGYFLEGVLANLDAARIELFAYPTDHKADALTERIRPRFAAWRPIAGLQDGAAAQAIHADAIHVLVDLAGHTAHNRLPVFAWRPAPVQVSWLGYFATTGVREIDYLLADPITVPDGDEVAFTERVWRLPETRFCFTAPEVDIAVTTLPAASAGSVTFCCFNSLSKVNDAVVRLWARVLQAVAGSRLILMSRQLVDETVRTWLRERFAAQDVEHGRLVLEGSVPRDQYLAAYGRADIALDPFPFTGGTTTAEALWMGVPVLTLAGDRLVSRQSAGLLTQTGLSDWIASDPDDYVCRASRHAGDLRGLALLRAGLRERVLASPVFDGPRFARHLETALWGMWQTFCASRPEG